jgi:hypothetical protein
MRLKVIACEVMKEELLAEAIDNAPDFEFVPQGLHSHPEKLNMELQKILDGTRGYSRVVLAFGMCGGGARNLKAGDFVLTIPRVHDCIALLLGSRERFDEVRREEPGTLYLSAGWVKGEAPVISEYGRTAAKYGEKRAIGLLRRIYNAYRRVLFISTRSQQNNEHNERSLEVARVLGLAHQQTAGDPRFIRRLVNGPWDDKNFINIPPHGAVDQLSFLDGAWEEASHLEEVQSDGAI